MEQPKSEGRYYVVCYGKALGEQVSVQPGASLPFSEVQACNSLKEAYEYLNSIDKNAFHEQQAFRHFLPQQIEAAGIFNEEFEILLQMRHLMPMPERRLPDGVYIELNSQLLSPQEFEKSTGYSLGNCDRQGAVLDYYLVPGTTMGIRVPPVTETLRTNPFISTRPLPVNSFKRKR